MVNYSGDMYLFEIKKSYLDNIILQVFLSSEISIHKKYGNGNWINFLSSFYSISQYILDL